VTTLAGTSGVPGSADGTGAAARFSSPSSMAIDGAGNLYLADWGNSTIRKITTAGVVTTLAGTAGSAGSADGVGAAARFTYPLCVAVDRSDNVYVSCGNHTIRKITPAGVVTTLAGTAEVPGSTDGTGAAARFNFPSCPTADPAGNVYVSDNGNHTIRKITPGGVVTTLAGAPGVPGSTDGTGAAARFHRPTGLAVDPAGNIYVSDTANSTIRKITATGAVTTVVGTPGRAGIILGTSPGLAFPSTMALAGDSIVFSDTSAILLLRHGAR
jgi:sugar lactone lactonase YvrE